MCAQRGRTPGRLRRVPQHGLVGPVHIFDHRHGRSSGRVDRGQEGGEQSVSGDLPAGQVGEFPAGLRGDVEQRAERPGGQQAVADTPQPAGPLGAGLERLQERGLAHPGLPGHQDQPAFALPGFTGVLTQRPQK